VTQRPSPYTLALGANNHPIIQQSSNHHPIIQSCIHPSSI
jgi:hypothetical protein